MPTMRAWQVTGFGEPEAVTELHAVEVPRPSPGQVLVRVGAVGLNLPDLMLCRGTFQARPPLPFTPGAEFAGTVVDGDGPTGQRVLCTPDLRQGLLAGGLAEYVAIDAKLTWVIPDEMPFTDAAALPVTYATAQLALHHRARLQPGETVLVHGGAGGVGVACVQLARLAGARVIATVSSAAKAEFCSALGATAVDHTAVDFVEAVRDLTDGRGADVIVDPVGGDTFRRSRRAIAWEGRHLVIGFASDTIPTLEANHVLLRNYSVVGINRDEYRYRDPATFRLIHQQVIDTYDAGGFRPVVGLTLPFDGLLDGWRALAERRVLGKVVVAL